MTNREYVMLEDKNGKEVLPVTDGNGVFVEGGTKKLDKKLTEINEQLDTKANKEDLNSKIWSMANMGQDIKEAMTGGSVAVVAENSVLAQNVVSQQITKEKTTIDFNIETLSKDPASGIWQTRDVIANHFSNISEI